MLDKDISSKETKKDQIKPLSLVRQLLLFSVGWVGFSLISMVVSLIVVLITKAPEITPSLYSLSFYLSYGFLFIFLFIIIIPYLNKGFLNSFKKIKSYIFGTILGLVLLGLNFAYSFLLSDVLHVGLNNNESMIRVIINTSPILAVIFIAFIGPACEELTYRVGLFDSLGKTKKWIAYLATIFVFAFIHFDFQSENLITELWNLPNYLIAGTVLTFAYDKFGLAASLIAHILNNFVGVIGNLL